MKKLTTPAPQAGRARSAPRGTNGSLARRRCTTRATSESADPARYHQPWSAKTWISGSAVEKARMIPPSATARYVAPTTSASRALRHQSRRSSRGRRAVRLRATKPSSTTIAVTPTGVSHRPPGTKPMKAWPHVRSRCSPGGRSTVRPARAAPAASSASPAQSKRPRGARRPAGGAVAGQGTHGEREQDPDHEVEHEDRAPARHREHRRAQQGAEHAARLLDRGDDAERHPAALHGVEVRDQRERCRDQATAAEPLQEAPHDHAGQVVGEGRDQRAEREDDQGRDQHRGSPAQVGDASDQRQHGDVAEQEARDDRRGPLELLRRDPGRGTHLGQGEDHDVGVRGGEGHRDGGEAEQQPRPRPRCLVQRLSLTERRCPWSSRTP